MTIVVLSALILFTLIGCAAASAGAMLVAERVWTRNATRDLIRRTEGLLRRQAAADIV